MQFSNFISVSYVCSSLILELITTLAKSVKIQRDCFGEINGNLSKISELTLLARLSRNLTAVSWSVLCIM